MPVKTVPIGNRTGRDAYFTDLRQQLVLEWTSGAAKDPKPLIREETDPQGRIVHVYVVWDAWQGIDENTRSEIVTNAFLATKGGGAILDLTVAMGLTREEAAAMGLDG